MSDQAELTVDGKNYTLPIVTGTEGERAIDCAVKPDSRPSTRHLVIPPVAKARSLTSTATRASCATAAYRWRHLQQARTLSKWPGY
jgi:hypothetical protein